MRVFATSDLHIDFDANKKWVDALSQHDYRDDVLIVAGDVTHDLRGMISFFEDIGKKFARVMFVPGNHDLWILEGEFKDSLEKFRRLMMLAEVYGLHTKPLVTETMAIVPLLGWYDYSFGQPSDELREIWTDFVACKWPEPEKAITGFFVSQNEIPAGLENKTVISFSHFLPRIDVMPVGMPEKFSRLFPVLGSSLIEAQVRQLRPQVHIYGHSHLNRRVLHDGTLYINNAFGYPYESHITAKELLFVHEE